MQPPAAYPQSSRDRTRWIVERRGPKHILNPWKPHAFSWEEERAESGELLPTATLFLTNRECPWRCLMCDLWQNTLDEGVPAGAIPAQIEHALERLPAARQVKLYNSGSFFDPRAIPVSEYAAIARLLAPYDRVIVECHPALVGDLCAAFRGMLPGRLEVAMGLETIHARALASLNKGFTLTRFQTACDALLRSDIDIRVFGLLGAPFVPAGETALWAVRTLQFAFQHGARVCSVIPARDGNGAMDALRAAGIWAPPNLRELEAAEEGGLLLDAGPVFADLWDIERFYTCSCSQARVGRLAAMNRSQRIEPAVECHLCRPAHCPE